MPDKNIISFDMLKPESLRMMVLLLSSLQGQCVTFDITQDYHLEGLPIGSRGGMVVRHNFPADGEYVFSGRLVRGVAEGYHGVEGHDRPHEFRVLVDGKTVFTSEVGTKEDHELSIAEGINVSASAIDARMTSSRIRVTAGPHDVAFTWQERAGREQNARGKREPGRGERPRARRPICAG